MNPAESSLPSPEPGRALDFLLADLPLLPWRSGGDPRRRQFAARWDFLPTLDGPQWIDHIHRPQRPEVEERLRSAARDGANFSLQYDFITAAGPQRVLDRGFADGGGYRGLWIDLENPVSTRRELMDRLHAVSQPLTIAMHWLQGSQRRVRRGHPAEAADVEVAIDRALAELDRAVRMLSRLRER